MLALTARCCASARVMGNVHRGISSSSMKAFSVRPHSASPSADERRVAVITGASSGIGLATANLLSGQGWAVHNISSNHKFDLTCRSSVHKAAAAVAEMAGNKSGKEKTVICVVHNASLHMEDSCAAFDAKAFDDSFALAVVAPGIITDALLPQMARGSSVLFIGSTLSEQAVTSRASYVTVKHAVIGLMRAYTQDLFGMGIHTACICPGFTDTPMLRKAPIMQTEEGDEFIRSKVSVGRL